MSGSGLTHRLCVETPLGPVTIEETAGAITGVRLGQGDSSEKIPPALARAAEALGEYFAGTRRDFDLPLDPQGTAFQKRVWQLLREIPYGSVKTYGQLAADLGIPGGARAVGNAAGKNPCLILIPCHRLVAATGIGGFSCGLDAKRMLMRLEGITK